VYRATILVQRGMLRKRTERSSTIHAVCEDRSGFVEARVALLPQPMQLQRQRDDIVRASKCPTPQAKDQSPPSCRRMQRVLGQKAIFSDIQQTIHKVSLLQSLQNKHNTIFICLLLPYDMFRSRTLAIIRWKLIRS
jgi:hypothetical protein